MNYQCVLCSRCIDKSAERYRTEGRGKFDILEALKSPPFEITNFETFICKQCLSKLKKRIGLVRQLNCLDNELKAIYQRSENDNTSTENKDVEHMNDSCSTPKKRCPAPSTSTPLLEFNRGCSPRELDISSISTGVKKAGNVVIKVNWSSKKSSRKLLKRRLV